MLVCWIGEHPGVDIVITLFRTWVNRQGPSETPPLSSQRTTVLCKGGKKFRDLGSPRLFPNSTIHAWAWAECRRSAGAVEEAKGLLMKASFV